MKTYSDSQIEATITWYLKTNPSEINLMLTDAKQFLLNALKAEYSFLSSVVVNDNKMNAFVDYIAPQVFNTIKQTI